MQERDAVITNLRYMFTAVTLLILVSGNFLEDQTGNGAGTTSFTANVLFGAGPGVTGSGTLTVIQFNALARGVSSVAPPPLVLLDSTLSTIPHSATDGRATVQEATSVPEPATLLLLLTGGVFIGLRKRRTPAFRRSNLLLAVLVFACGHCFPAQAQVVVGTYGPYVWVSQTRPGQIEVSIRITSGNPQFPGLYLWEYDVHNLSFDPIGEGVNGFSVEPAVDVPEKTNFTSPTNSWRTDNSQFNSPAHRVTWIQNPVGPGILPGDTGRFSFTTLPRQPQLVAGVPNPVLSGVGNHGFAVDPTSRIICCRITGDLVVPSTPSQVIPVILIPGILGTSLYNGNDLLWVDLVEACLLPNHDIPDLQLLALAATGTSAAGIHTGSILDGTVGGLLSFKINFYGGLENALSQAGYQQNRLLFPFPYDWRLDNAGNADLLETFIENTVLPVSGSSTVDIVAHSMGGLLVRRYAERYGTARVDKVIYLGTPHTGAAKAFGPLAFNNALNGFLGYPCINNGTLAALSRTFPSAFELLPRSPFIFSNALQRTLTLDESYKQPPDGFGFLVSSRWVDAANAFHQSIAVTANMAQYVIVGSGFPTLAGFTLQTNPSSTPRRLCAESGDGDNTVPTSSSTALGFLNTFYVKRVKHDELPNNGIVQKLVLDILANNLMSLPQDVSRDPFTPTGTLNFCTGSPVSVSISDVRSSQDGIGSDGETRTDIDGSEFVVFESNQTGFVESNQPYQFTLTGTAIGVFSLTIQQKDENGTVLGSIQFTDIPVSAHSVGTFTLVPNDFSPVLSVDVDGNGTVDVVFATNQPPPPTASVAALRLIVQGLGLDKGITTSLRAKLDAALAGLATGRMTDVRGNLTAFKNEVQAQAGKAITSVDAQGLVNIVDHILAIR